ncbi:retron St85 family RNA-directed DNA polymerase [Duganella radicis]|nr:retron St85 family RNA-directed DNA polymerase [Duganella radicis]
MDATNSQLLNLLCDELPFTRTEAWELIRSAPRRYKVHFIEKRNGRGKRLIAQPTAELKAVQRWVVTRFISQMPIHDAASAYRTNRSIGDHARLHARNKYLLKIDFKDFFPSIGARDFKRHAIKYLAIDARLASELALLLFRRDEHKRFTLSIGAPSSPVLSNTLMYEFDSKLSEFCEPKGITYSRYADDLALSTNKPHELDTAFKFINELLNDLAYPRLTINQEKTVFASKKHQRKLTGLTLTNAGDISLGRERKREIRAMADHYRKGKLEGNRHGQLKGWLAFALSVEPEFVRTIRKLLGEEMYAALLSFGDVSAPLVTQLDDRE